MFKNLSIRNKLLFIVLPAILELCLLLFLFYRTVTSTYEDSRKIFYNNLYMTHSALLNSDRDFYQASLSAERINSMIGGDETALSDLRDNYKENAQQTTDNANKILEYLADDPQLLDYYTTHNLFVLVNGSETAEDPNGFCRGIKPSGCFWKILIRISPHGRLPMIWKRARAIMS